MKFSTSTFFVTLFLSAASLVRGGGGGGGGGDGNGGDTNITIEVDINVFVCNGNIIQFNQPGLNELCRNGQACYEWGNPVQVVNGDTRELTPVPVQQGCTGNLGFEMNINEFAQAVGFPNGVINVCNVNTDPVYPEFLTWINERQNLGYRVVYRSSKNVCTARRLKGESFLGMEEATLQILEKCGRYEYEGFLHVTDHLYALAVPSQEAQEADCPHMAAHAVIGDRHDPLSAVARKEMIMWSDPKEFADAFPSHGSMSFGTFHGDSMVRAYQEAETSNKDVAVYDVIKNSCGVFIVSLASELGVQVDGRVTSFVSRRLMEHAGKELTSKIRESIYFPSFKKGLGRRLGAGNMENGVLLEALVKETAANILN